MYLEYSGRQWSFDVCQPCTDGSLDTEIRYRMQENLRWTLVWHLVQVDIGRFAQGDRLLVAHAIHFGHCLADRNCTRQRVCRASTVVQSQATYSPYRSQPCIIAFPLARGWAALARSCSMCKRWEVCPRWFARPQHLRWPGTLLMQPLSARCMRVLLRLRMGAHSPPVVLGRRTGAPRPQRLCQRCDQHAVGDQRHMVFECAALQCVRDEYAALTVHGACTMQQFMWQVDLTGVAYFIKDCFAVLDAPV